METTEAVARFLSAKEARGLSPQTILFYRHWLTKFAAAAVEIPTDPLPIEQFISGWQDVTRKNAFRAIHALYAWLIRNRLFDPWSNPLQYMERPRTPKRLPRIFNDSELARLMDAARTQHDRALVLVLLDGAPRIGELVGRTKDDLTGEGLLVNGKTGPRMVPLLPSTIAYLRELSTFHLFPIKDKHGRYVDQPAKVNTLKGHFAAIIQRAEITGRRRGPHTVRHSSATAWLRSSHDIDTLKQVLGHQSVRETEIYTALLRAHELAQAHRQHSALKQAEARQMKMAL